MVLWKMLSQRHHLDDEPRRFIALFDELYHRKIMLIVIVIAGVDLMQLYQGNH
jgi:predicted ATPase